MTDIETPAGFTKVEITREPLELYKILKIENTVGSGGEAKLAISEGHVSVNGMIETRKRKKIVSGDRIEFAGQKLFISLLPTANTVTSEPPAAKYKSRKPIRALTPGTR